MSRPAKDGPDEAKLAQLRQSRTLHPHPERVTDELFLAHEFFDAHDLVQVKYEMLRRVANEQWPISRAAGAFGLSRPAFYQAQSALESAGLAGLIPQAPGPRSAHKLSEELLQFLERLLTTDPSLKSSVLAQKILEQFAISVHPRSVERALSRRRKKGR